MAISSRALVGAVLIACTLVLAACAGKPLWSANSPKTYDVTVVCQVEFDGPERPTEVLVNVDGTYVTTTQAEGWRVEVTAPVYSTQKRFFVSAFSSSDNQLVRDGFYREVFHELPSIPKNGHLFTLLMRREPRRLIQFKVPDVVDISPGLMMRAKVDPQFQGDRTYAIRPVDPESRTATFDLRVYERSPNKWSNAGSYEAWLETEDTLSTPMFFFNPQDEDLQATWHANLNNPLVFYPKATIRCYHLGSHGLYVDYMTDKGWAHFTRQSRQEHSLDFSDPAYVPDTLGESKANKNIYEIMVPAGVELRIHQGSMIQREQLVLPLEPGELREYIFADAPKTWLEE